MNQPKRISIRPIPKDDPDLRRLARAIIELVVEEQRAEAAKSNNNAAPDDIASPCDIVGPGKVIADPKPTRGSS